MTKEQALVVVRKIAEDLADGVGDRDPSYVRRQGERILKLLESIRK